MGFAEYDEYDGLGLAELVDKGEVSPRELVDAAIERCESRNPKFNAVIQRLYDLGRSTAEGELPDGPFRGVPFLMKDMLSHVGGIPTTNGCRFYRSWIAPHDSNLTKRFKAAGLVIFGKTNAPEFGIVAVTEPELHGPTYNPWNIAHSPGGSSGGAAAAVAARIVPMAHGGDGGGSIRIPSAWTGLFGLKPTRGRNPIGPDLAESWNGQVVEHVLTRSVRDSAAMLDCTAGRDRGAPIAEPGRPRGGFLKQVGKKPGKLRIAWTAKPLYGTETHPDAKAALNDAVALCAELGHEMVQAHPRVDRSSGIRAYLTSVAACTAHEIVLAERTVGRTPRREDFELTTWFLHLVGKSLSATDLLEARHTVNGLTRSVAAFFDDYDLLLTPTTAYPPVEIGEGKPNAVEKTMLRLVTKTGAPRAVLHKALDQLAERAFEKTPNTMLFNQTGHPGMSVPLFWNSSDLPIGMQFVAPFGEEARLFRLAAQLEEARPWSDRRPRSV